MVPSLDIDFSYLKINNLTYTVTSTCILNDFINHPVYKILINDFIVFDTWRNRAKEGMYNKLQKIKREINEIVTKEFYTEKDISNEIDGNFFISRSQQDNKSKKKYIEHLRNGFYDLLTENEYIDKLKKVKTILKDNIFSIKPKFGKITSLINEYITLSSVDDIYFKGASNSISSADKIINEVYVQKNYIELVNFNKIVQQFISPNRETTHTNIQRMMNDFFNKKNRHFEKYLNFINNKYFKHNKNEKFPDDLHTEYGLINDNHLLFIGVSKYSVTNNEKLKYEAYVAFNVILGVLNYENMSQISCSYKDDNLGNSFESLKKKKNRNVQKVYLDLKIMFGNEKRNEANEIKIGGKISKKLLTKNTRIKNKKITVHHAFLQEGFENYLKNSKLFYL